MVAWVLCVARQETDATYVARRNICHTPTCYFASQRRTYFHAKLYEFSQLMSNYHVIDLSCIQDSSEPRPSIINDNFEFEEEENDGENIKWPSVIKLHKQDAKTLKSFFQTDEIKSEKGPTEEGKIVRDDINGAVETNSKKTEQVLENSTNVPEERDKKD
ncbi:unnamed protein product [Arctia plantaginis]|uniref:Uncharacterized protein n=1 Tax=Arctia plantaginis TaxID=874455 RepID=A0A8S1AHT3_ARCPL|nr:unnamed protein product [Arctia plantaginis]